MAFSPDGRLLAAGDGTASVKLWETATFAETATFSGHTTSVNSLAFSADGRALVSRDVEAGVNVWTLPREIVPSCRWRRSDSKRYAASGKKGRILWSDPLTAW